MKKTLQQREREMRRSVATTWSLAVGTMNAVKIQQNETSRHVSTWCLTNLWDGCPVCCQNQCTKE